MIPCSIPGRARDVLFPKHRDRLYDSPTLLLFLCVQQQTSGSDHHPLYRSFMATNLTSLYGFHKNDPNFTLFLSLNRRIISKK